MLHTVPQYDNKFSLSAKGRRLAGLRARLRRHSKASEYSRWMALQHAIASLIPNASSWLQPQLTAVPSAAGKIALDDLLAAADSGRITSSLLHFGEEQVVLRLPRAGASDLRGAASKVLERDGNLVFKDAQYWLPAAAECARAAHEATRVGSVHANVYVSRGGLSIARAAHTDPGAIFVLQTAGSKHWRVWAPPAPRDGAHPLERGHGADVLDATELTAPLLEATLEPGSLLFVGTGFAHATATADADADADADDANATDKLAPNVSVHVTLGVQTHLDRLTLLSILPDALHRAQLRSRLEPDLSHLPPAQRAAALAPLLAAPRLLGALRDSDDDGAEYDAFVEQLLAAVRAAVPEVAGADADAEDGGGGGGMASRLGAAQLASRLEEHAARLVAEERARLARVVRGETVDAAAAEAEKTAARNAMRDWYAECAAWDAAGVCDSEQLEALLDECPGACAERRGTAMGTAFASSPTTAGQPGTAVGVRETSCERV